MNEGKKKAGQVRLEHDFLKRRRIVGVHAGNGSSRENDLLAIGTSHEK